MISRRPVSVIQTSALDCGPASLSCLLRGIGAPGAYEALRDMCATDVDGTSIDALEDVAVRCGTDAEQLVLPAEHVLALPGQYLPAVVAVRLPDGFPHFVVAWRKTRRGVVLMDPAVGVRWVTHRQFLSMLYQVEIDVDPSAWREWAGSPIFTSALKQRLIRLGLRQDDQQALIDSALADSSARTLAELDASIRIAEKRGSRTARRGTLLQPDADAMRHASFFERESRHVMRGAVILRAAKYNAKAGDQSVIDKLSEAELSPTQILRQLMRHPLITIIAMIIAALCVAAPAVIELDVLRPLSSITDNSRLTPAQVCVIVGTAILGVTAYFIAYQCGRNLEIELRTAWWSVVSTLPDSFSRTRPTSDTTERGHLLHRIREIPLYALRSMLSLGIIVGGCVTASVVAPSTTPFAVLLVLALVAIPVLTFRRIADADVDARTLSGALARFTYDGLLGAEAVQATGCQRAIQYEQDNALTAWRLAQRRLLSMTLGTRLAAAVSGGVLAAACVVTARVGLSGTFVVMATVVLAVDSTSVLSEALRALSQGRSSVVRAAGALSTTRIKPPQSRIQHPADLRLSNVSLTVGATPLLVDISATVAAGSKVAVVGRSGSGKSSLLSVLLGFMEPTSGSIQWGGQPLDAASLRSAAGWSSVETTLWDDDLLSNVRYGAEVEALDPVQRLDSACASDLMTRLERRAERFLGQKGSALSDGEAQRVRFARALGRPSAPLVIFDEPFRGLPCTVRSRLLQTTFTVWRDATVICALHDFAAAAQFDRVIVMDRGRIVETGTPAELLSDASSMFHRYWQDEQTGDFDSFTVVHVGGAAT
jgi:ABC-type bacteriocin/lantibiotic exporter with double-glycine peptidase domain